MRPIREKAMREDNSISAEEIISDICQDLPRSAVFLAGLRFREGLTQKQLGKALKIAQSNISMMEKGTRPIGKGLAKRLAKYFNTDYRMFL